MGSNLSGPLFFFLSDLKKKTKEKEEALLDLALKLHRQVNLFILLTNVISRNNFYFTLGVKDVKLE